GRRRHVREPLEPRHPGWTMRQASMRPRPEEGQAACSRCLSALAPRMRQAARSAEAGHRRLVGLRGEPAAVRAQAVWSLAGSFRKFCRQPRLQPSDRREAGGVVGEVAVRSGEPMTLILWLLLITAAHLYALRIATVRHRQAVREALVSMHG